MNDSSLHRSAAASHPVKPASEDDLAIEEVEAAEALLPPDAAASGLKSFFSSLYRGATPDDIVRYTPEALATLAQLVFEKTAHRKPGETTVAAFAFRGQRRRGVPAETILVAANDDIPFLFDSLVAELGAQELRIHALFHPVIRVVRSGDGRRGETGDKLRESTIVLALDPMPDKSSRETLAAAAERVLAQVKLAVWDWPKMLAHLRDTIAALKSHPPRIAAEIVNESVAFLEWLADNHFTFLGARDYAYFDAGGGKLSAVPGSGLGVLASAEARVVRRGREGGKLTPEARAFLKQPDPLIITKSNERSAVHRRVHMDYVGVKMFNAKGNLAGERRFVGLFTSGAYSRRPGDIPLLRLKVARVLERAGFAPDSHDGKALAHILDSFPRDELFRIGENELFDTALGILRLGERPKVRLFFRFDRFDRFVSALVFVPRDRYDTRAREKIHAILARAFDGKTSAATPTLGDSALARVHYIVGRNEGPRPKVDARELEVEIRDAVRTWEDGFADALAKAHGEESGAAAFARQASAFPQRYRDAFSPEEAVRDLSELESLARAETGTRIEARSYRKPEDTRSALRLKVYVCGGVLPLSASLPVFENLGFRVIAEDSYPVTLDAGEEGKAEAAVLDFAMERADGAAVDLGGMKDGLERAFQAIIAGETENDGFNRLVIAAGLDWNSVNILRAIAKFLRQAGFPFGQNYIEGALARNPDIAALLVDLFHARHAPGMDGRERKQAAIRNRIDKALNDVPSLDEDRIVRRLRNAIACSLRTNFYCRSDRRRPCLAIKFDSHKLDELPAPRPLYEIFVYSPQVEGVHLRFGMVARGGIRWSDRREDFRTEILGLAKAQQVKNAVIVPVGAKGGFYPKRLPPNGTREEVQAAAISAYKNFIEALLDLTDNIGPDGAVIPPKGVVRHDGDDTYLVVAADKGTASFSDIANGIAEARGFWLGDAFASGGSHGYDHKKMGVTAKGAWEAVKRHFREMNRDIQTEPFTCVGIGDMSGDVFGNGMLLSKQTRLLAAFDHRDIFIDPDPGAAASWIERKRLFDLPRSSWKDYDKSLISKGGGVYARDLKEIPVSAQLRKLTGLAGAKASPAEVMKALLKADVDLLWFGGIGTFVKAASQTNSDVGDRANDGIRVDGSELRAKAVGEGANLGVTQLGRVEYALNGGRIDTDAIDNSAGVDTSDHEVNLKILFSGPLRRGEMLSTERDRLLAAMAAGVERRVLKDTYDQTLALSVAQARGLNDLDAQCRFMRELERRGKLDRKVEFLPDDAQLRRRGQEGFGLARPELSVLLAYAKLDLDAELIASTLPDDSYFGSTLARYYPHAAIERCAGELPNLRLRREIVSTELSNRIVNLAGAAFVHRMKEVSGAPAARVGRAFVVADGAFGLETLKARIDALDYKVPAAVQTGMYVEIAELLRRLGVWFLVNVAPDADLADTVARHRAGVEQLRGTFSTLISPYEAHDTESRIGELVSAGTPLDVAEDVAVLPLLGAAPEISKLAHARALDIDLVAGAYFAIGAKVGLDRVRGLAARISAAEHWDRLAIRRIMDDLFASQRALTAQALQEYESDPVDRTRAEGAKAAERWAQANAGRLGRTQAFLNELERTGDLSIAKLTLANSQIRGLAAV